MKNIWNILEKTFNFLSANIIILIVFAILLFSTIMIMHSINADVNTNTAVNKENTHPQYLSYYDDWEYNIPSYKAILERKCPDIVKRHKIKCFMVSLDEYNVYQLIKVENGYYYVPVLDKNGNTIRCTSQD